MGDQDSNPADAGQVNPDQKGNDVTTPIDDKGIPAGTTPKPDDTGQGETIPIKDYKELQADHTRKSQSLTDAQKEIDELKDWKTKAEQAVGSPKPSFNESKETSDDLRREAQEYENQGLNYEAKDLRFRATQLERQEATDKKDAHVQEFNDLLFEVSKPDSPIDGELVDWKAVGKIATERNLNPRAAFGQWVAGNMKSLNEATVQKELETRVLAGGATTHEDGGIVEPETEDAELTAFRKLIGPPGGR